MAVALLVVVALAGMGLGFAADFLPFAFEPSVGAMMISSFAVGVKRLHDRDQSGWWIVLFYFGPGVASAIGQSSVSGAVYLVLSLLSFAISIWAIVVLGFLRGTRGPNRYGPDPLEAHTVAPVTTSRA